MTLLRTFALACLCTLPLVAAAQWQWIDKDGRRVFSDKAPPPDVPAKNILRQPGQRGPTPMPAEPEPQAAAKPAAAASAPQVSGRDKTLEQRRKQQAEAEAEKAKAQEAQVAAQREDNCRRARQTKANIDAGMRLSRTNAKGEREILNDQERAEEIKIVNALIERDCKPQ